MNLGTVSNFSKLYSTIIFEVPKFAFLCHACKPDLFVNLLGDTLR